MLIKKIIPESIKIRIRLFFTRSNQQRWVDAVSNEKRNVFVFLCGYYQNLGDLAITYSQIKFLEVEFPTANIVPVPSVETYNAVKTIRRHIRKDDLITILGGGNMDDTYISLENARLYTIKSFKHNHIVSFPQTYAFSDTRKGRMRERISKKVYESNRMLTIFVREQLSLQRIKAALPKADIRYCPDIVLSLMLPVKSAVRDKILICLRKDAEQRTRKGFAEELISEAKKHYQKIIVRDTVDIPLKDCQPDIYEKTLNDFWAMIQECRVVITDRLHCMLFCVINRTPCIVLDNTNHKISEIYKDWINNIPYILLADDNDIDAVMTRSLQLSEQSYTNYEYDFSKQFTSLIKSLHE